MQNTLKVFSFSIIIILSIFCVSKAEAVGFTKLVSFTGNTGDFLGAAPFGSLVEMNGKFYGVTEDGGTNNVGVIFSFIPDNSGSGTYNKLYDFGDTNNNSNGAYPYGSLVFNNGKFYGITSYGGANGVGVIFSYDPDTNTYLDKVDFTGTSGNFMGANPYGSLIFNNGKFYGMTASGGTNAGGTNGDGVIFSYDPNTNTYLDKVNFTGTSGNFMGTAPLGSLVESNGKFYGMTFNGGTHDLGVIFSYDPTGEGTYTKLYSFGDGGSNLNGSFPSGFIIMNRKLYGTTNSGGTNGYGVIFSYDLFSNIYTIKYNFDGVDGNCNMMGPCAGPIASGGKLYGVTPTGGVNNVGTIYSYDLTGNGTYTKLYDFGDNSGNSNGGIPMGSLIISGSKLYGTTFQGGANSYGTIFSYELPSTTSSHSSRHHSTGSSQSRLSQQQIAQIFGLPEPQTPPTVPPETKQGQPLLSSPACTITHILKLHSIYTEEVKCLQTLLNITSDGIFGPHTRQAVIDFQKLHKLTPDGVVGEKTRAELNK